MLWMNEPCAGRWSLDIRMDATKVKLSGKNAKVACCLCDEKTMNAMNEWTNHVMAAEV